MVDSVNTDPLPKNVTVLDVAEDALAFERDKALNLRERIHKVMAEVGGHIDKDGTIKLRGNDVIEYISHDAVTNHIRAACIKHGLFVHPTVDKLENNGNRTELTIGVEFSNIDDPGDCIVVRSVGYGVDSSDKGPGKAWSYAVKYAYLKLFMLNSADDIEQTDLPHDPEAVNQSAVDSANDEAMKAREAWAYSLRDSIAAVKTLDDLRKLRQIHKSALDDAPASTAAYFNAAFETRKVDLAAEQPPVDA